MYYAHFMISRGERVKMLVTSVLGHLHEYDFQGKYRSWGGCRYIDLFDAPIEKQVRL
jgi:hypothetical protein